MPGALPDAVDFHFDPMCPFAYQTSVWVRSVRDRTGLQVTWRFFSLEEVNRAEGKKHPWERDWSYGWSLMRVGALLRRRSMDELDAWYATIGRALHVEGRKPHRPEVARELLAGMGLPATLVDDALADPTTSDEVLAEHRRVVDAGGFGVPTLFFPDGQCLFGPVLVDPPSGDEAVALWEAVAAWTAFPRLYELQRPKGEAQRADLARSLTPYLHGRDWQSVDRGRVVNLDRLLPGAPAGDTGSTAAGSGPGLAERP